jgi:hypothetical protein
MIVKQQGMEVFPRLCRLRTDSWSLSMFMLNAWLTLSWPGLVTDHEAE